MFPNIVSRNRKYFHKEVTTLSVGLAVLCFMFLHTQFYNRLLLEDRDYYVQTLNNYLLNIEQVLVEI